MKVNVNHDGKNLEEILGMSKGEKEKIAKDIMFPLTKDFILCATGRSDEAVHKLKSHFLESLQALPDKFLLHLALEGLEKLSKEFLESEAEKQGFNLSDCGCGDGDPRMDEALVALKDMDGSYEKAKKVVDMIEKVALEKIADPNTPIDIKAQITIHLKKAKDSLEGLKKSQQGNNNGGFVSPFSQN